MKTTVRLICLVVLIALLVYSYQGYLPPFPAAVIGTVVVLLVIVIIPRALVKEHAAPAETKGPLELENEYRQTLVQIVGGVAIIVTVYSAFQSYDLSRRGQIADRTFKALEMLSKDDEDAKVAAVYALERIANEDEASEWPIVETLFNYTRVHTKWSGTLQELETVHADVSAIIDFLRRRPVNGEFHQRFDYTNCENDPTQCTKPDEKNRDYFRMINFPEVDLRGAFLEYAMMKAIRLRDAHLEGAFLNYAHFEDAWAAGSHFEDADMTGSYWTIATLRNAYLKRTKMSGAHLSGADLENADLSCADLKGAILKYAKLRGANLDGTILIGADLRHVEGLRIEQLENAEGDASTILPDQMTPPASWSHNRQTQCPLSIVSITTDPPNADILIDGKVATRTPAKFELSRNGTNKRTITVSLSGYRSVQTEIWPPGGPTRISLFLEKDQRLPHF